MKTRDFFTKNQVFRRKEFEEAMGSSSPSGLVSSHQIQRLLAYHVTAGHIINIRRNLYASTIASSAGYTNHYLIAAKASNDAVIAYHTALEFYGVAYTTFEELTYLSRCYTKDFMFKNLLFKCIRPPSILLNSQLYYNFVDEIKYEGLTIKITSLERTIVDVLDKPGVSGGWEEIWRSLEFLPAFDPVKVVNYALLLEKGTTIAKVGYFLESLPIDIKIDDQLLDELEKRTPESAHYINKNKKSKLFKRWNLMVPLELVNKSWEEPYEDNV